MHVDNLKAYKKFKRALIQIVIDFLDRRLPVRRIVFVASILKNCNIEIPDKDRLSKYLLEEQKSDGGWVDCEDTAWSVYFLSDRKDFEANVKKGLLWLEGERCDNKGWGFCKRDRSCIPITAQIFYLLPHFSQVLEAAYWLENEWKKDLYSPINLNYKAAWYLLAYKGLQSKIDLSLELFSETIRYLSHEQREDGGWGPWKNHPASTDCFITGICMASLALSYSVSKDQMIIQSLKKGIEWIRDKQLENGLFPTHYIEEGSAWIFLGWTKALDIIKDIDI